MTLVPNTILTGLVDRLLAHFTPAFEAWKKTHPEPPATARECLRHDLLSIGQAVAALDHTGQRIETRLIAEVLAALQENHSLPYAYTLEVIDREIAGKPRSPLPDLLMSRIVREWKAGPDASREIVAALAELVNYFVLYDGKVSNREIGFFGELEKQFSG